jgi:hypothetical protein
MAFTVDGIEAWEDELDMWLGLGMNVRGWDVLRHQIHFCPTEEQLQAVFALTD